MNALIEHDDYEGFCRGSLDDPYPLYHRLRAEDPVHWCVPLNSWILTRYSDVLAASRDPKRLGSDRVSIFMGHLPPTLQAVMKPLDEHMSKWMVMQNPPDHTRLRSLVNQAFTPRVVEGMRSRVEEIVNALLDQHASKGELDLISDFAYPLPTSVICGMLGIPGDDQDRFRNWSTDVASFTTAGAPTMAERAEQAQRSLLQLTEYVDGIAEQRRRKPCDDLISAMIAVEEEGSSLTHEELLAMTTLLFIAGHETTMYLIGNAILALLRNPEQLRLLKDNPTLITSAVEEFLRYDGPLQRQTRLAHEDLEIGGRSIRKGEAVLLMHGAANRDPAQFQNPDQLDICRADNRHLAFGFGIHFCVGAWLARLEGQIAIPAILRRLPSLRLGTETVQWKKCQGLRGLESLPVRFN